MDPSAAARTIRKLSICNSRSLTSCGLRAALTRRGTWTSYVLERQRAVLGAEHLLTLMTANSLGADLKALGEFRRRSSPTGQTYDRFKEEFGEDFFADHWPPPITWPASLRLVGDYDAAPPSRSGQLRPSPDGHRPADHPYTLSTAVDPGRAICVRQARSGNSVELLRDTWERYRAVLGDDMIDTLRAATGLAVSLRKAGDQAEAMELAQDTYEPYSRRYGSESPEGAILCASIWRVIARRAMMCRRRWRW